MTDDALSSSAGYFRPLAESLNGAFSQPFFEPPLVETLQDWRERHRALVEDLIGGREKALAGRSGCAFDRLVLWRDRQISIAVHRWPSDRLSVEAQARVDFHNHVGPAASVLLRGELLHRTYGSDVLAEAASAWLCRGPVKLDAPPRRSVLRTGDAYGLSADTFHHMMSNRDNLPASYTLFCTGRPVFMANFHLNVASGAVRLHLSKAHADTLSSVRDDANFEEDPTRTDRLLALLRRVPNPGALHELVYVC